jgi:uncharacterized protein involved in exopolysaccharide biosynthesis
LNAQPSPENAAPAADASLSFLDLLLPLVSNLRSLLIAPIATGLLALGATYLVAPTYTATTSFLLPQQQQSAAASALASLGALTGLPSGGSRTMADQFVALMQSTTVSDRVIEKAELLSVYEVDFKADARRLLASSVRISVGKKDGLVSVEVDDKSAQRAAAIANHYVDELRRLTSALAVTEAQQRRKFFEGQLQQTRDKLAQAQTALQASGFSQGALQPRPMPGCAPKQPPPRCVCRPCVPPWPTAPPKSRRPKTRLPRCAGSSPGWKRPRSRARALTMSASTESSSTRRRFSICLRGSTNSPALMKAARAR